MNLRNKLTLMLLISLVVAAVLYAPPLFHRYDLIQFQSKTSAKPLFDVKAAAGAEKTKLDKASIQILKKCPVYKEFRDVNFRHPIITNSLCQKSTAFELDENFEYPLCILNHPANQQLVSKVKANSNQSYLVNIDAANPKLQLPIYIYASSDLISDSVRRSHGFENEEIRFIMRLTKGLGQTTFMDMGSNLGIFTVAAAALGLPTISLDANIRNLLRLQLSLQLIRGIDMHRNLLAWNFIGPDSCIKHLYFQDYCNVGGASKLLPKSVQLLEAVKAYLKDSVPIMEIPSRKLVPFIKTKKIVIKMDIQGGEADFLETSGSMFDKLDVVAIMMEWHKPYVTNGKGERIINYLTRRKYQPRNMQFTVENLNNPNRPQTTNILWIREDYLQRLKDVMKKT